MIIMVDINMHIVKILRNTESDEKCSIQRARESANQIAKTSASIRKKDFVSARVFVLWQSGQGGLAVIGIVSEFGRKLRTSHFQDYSLIVVL